MLPALSVEGWMTPSELAFLQAIVFTLPEGAKMVEVGSWKGRSTVAICEVLEVIGGRLTAVDTFRGDVHIGDALGVEEEFRKNTLNFANLLDVVVSESVAASATVANRSLDCVFVDASHTYDEVLADLHAWAPKLKDGATMCGHDYGHHGLTLAVHRCYGRVPHWETIWYSRARAGVHTRFTVEALLRRLFR